ncbi:MAG: amidohydrolase family protein, partial [Ilumatobacter sp.]|nr:amidohydrolase family protein [Ilumatobacter sp.]
MRGACDTHIHVYDQRYPVSPEAVLRPPDATLADYATVQRELGLDRAVIVQPTTYGLDNRCQLEAVAALGDRARAVVV